MPEWATRAVYSDQPFGSWADDLAAAFVRLEPRRLTDDVFRGAIAKVEAGPVSISRVEATAHSVMRQRAHIASGHGDVYFVNLQLSGLSRSTQFARDQIAGPGDVAVVDTTDPFEIVNSRDFALFCIAVPRALLPGDFAVARRPALSSSDAGRCFARLLASYADLCLRPSMPGVTGWLGGNIVDLLRHRDDLLGLAGDSPTPSAKILSRMLEHIDEHFADPTLDATRLALRFGCSVRYVHKLFAGTGRSVGMHVTDRRLDASARRLLDSRHTTIAAIAYDCGFSDISHFNRLFKRRNGVSPRAFREDVARAL